MARSNPRKWPDKSIKKLLATRGWSGADLQAAFPDVPLNTLRDNRKRFEVERPELMPAAPSEVEAIEIERAANTVERSVHEKTLRELYAVKHKQADYIATLREAVMEAVSMLDIRPVPKPPTDKRRKAGAEEAAFALLSDLQTGKVTPDYDTDVCRERVMRYARKIVELTEIQRKDHPVRVCHVGMLGDMIEGVDIFPGQAYLLDSTLYQQLMKTTPQILVEFVRYLLAHFDRVVVWAVQGNHGRIGRKGTFGPEDNADRMLYYLLSLLLADEPRVEFNMADPKGERAWYLVARIGNYRAMLIHGDQIRGSSGYPWYGLGKKVHSWASGGVPDTFDDICLGHYHQLGAMPLNKRMAWANGAVESTNTFAAETLAAQSDPKQWLLFIHPDKGMVTASYPVYLLED
jgi:hypothetical protein